MSQEKFLKKGKLLFLHCLIGYAFDEIASKKNDVVIKPILASKSWYKKMVETVSRIFIPTAIYFHYCGNLPQIVQAK